MGDATELQEYDSKAAEFKKGAANKGNGEDEGAFAIDEEEDEEPITLEANNHKPLVDPESPKDFPLLTSTSLSSPTPTTTTTATTTTTTTDSPSSDPLTTTTTSIPTSTPSPEPSTMPVTSTTSTAPTTTNTTIAATTTSPTPSSPVISPPPASPSTTKTDPLSSKPTTPSTSATSTPTASPRVSREHPSKPTRTSSLLNSSTGSLTPDSERKNLSYDERLKVYEDAFQSDILEINLLRELSWQGVPETKGLRAKYWKIMLHYLPLDKSLWETSLAKSRKLYQDWVNELVIDPHATTVHSDHPLSQDQDSKWNAFFKDNEILAEIDKDVKRTFPHLHFFNQISPTGQQIESPHYHVLKRILFIYAKLNPGIRYVQGMNELLGPIYYTFATDSDPAFKEHAEADAFFCFTNLMSEVMDNFCKTLDKSEMGIVGNMKRLNMLLKEQDPELWSNLEEKKMNPQFYTFRWITLLLSQEFELPEVLRLWDSLFADPERFNFFYCFCCAMVICVREKILNGSFADNLKLLQSYPPIDFQVIFATAQSVHDKTYVPPPARAAKPDAAQDTHHSHSHSHQPHTHAHAHPHPPTNTTSPTPSLSTKLSFPTILNKISPSSSPAVAKAAAAEKPKEKPQEPKESKPTVINLPLGLGKFTI